MGNAVRSVTTSGHHSHRWWEARWPGANIAKILNQLSPHLHLFPLDVEFVFVFWEAVSCKCVQQYETRARPRGLLSSNPTQSQLLSSGIMPSNIIRNALADKEQQREDKNNLKKKCWQYQRKCGLTYFENEKMQTC